MKSYRSVETTKDPFMSPLLASDDMLSGLPPVHIVVSAQDLDDLPPSYLIYIIRAKFNP